METYKAKNDISWKLLKDSVVVVNTTTGVYYTLNPTASVIWQNLIESGSTSGIADKMCEIFDNIDKDTIQNDIDECVTFWKAEEIIEPNV
jgi:hypothetical protein